MKEIERMWCARSGRGPGLLGTFACLAVMASLAAFSAAHEKKSGEPSGVLALDAAADGDRINLLLAVRPPGAAGVKLQHVRSRDGGESWGSPTTILPGRAKIATPHRGADPQIPARQSV